MADMKGDLSGISKAGTLNSFIAKRQEEFGVTFQFQGYPTRFFDVFAEKGHPLRTNNIRYGTTIAFEAFDVERHPVWIT
jgi:hypothetical protein